MHDGYFTSNRRAAGLARPVVTPCCLLEARPSKLARRLRIMPAVPERPITSTASPRVFPAAPT